MTELFPALKNDFQGVLTMTSSKPFVPLAQRLTVNERGENIYSMLAPADLQNPPTGPLFLPQIAFGAGFNTQITITDTGSNQETVDVLFYDDTGTTMNTPIQ